jgi:predicted GNAT family acetyltransferase
MLAGVAGIHVYSEEYRTAALGNIATHPDYRNKQIAYKLTSALCIDLMKNTDLIGLNVKADNEFAIRCYKKTGFEIVGRYDECIVETV